MRKKEFKKRILKSIWKISIEQNKLVKDYYSGEGSMGKLITKSLVYGVKQEKE